MNGQESGWAIMSKHGLYVDWRQTRAEIIARHVHDLASADEELPSQFSRGGKLDALQRERWKRCKKNGDRAVKVTIRW